MNYLNHYLEFSTVEEGEKCLAEATEIKNSMGGSLFKGIIMDDCNEIARKLDLLKRSQKEVSNA